MWQWQERRLIPPPVCTLEVTLDEGAPRLLKDARRILEESSQPTAVHRALGCEIYLLRKMVGNRTKSLKNERCRQGLQQLEKCLERLIEITPLSLMKSFLESWPCALNIHYGATVYLPSRQMLEFLLVRLIGMASLLQQALNHSILTHTAALDQIKIGMQIVPMFIFNAVASRIWLLCRSMKQEMIKWYTQLIPLMEVLRPTKVVWLRGGFQFPKDLWAWLGKEMGRPQRKSQEEQTDAESLDAILRRWDLNQKSAVDDVLEPQVKEENDSLVEEQSTFPEDHEDLGESICRDDFHKPKPDLESDVKPSPYKTTGFGNPDNGRGASVSPAKNTSLPVKRNGAVPEFSESFWFNRVDRSTKDGELCGVLEAFQRHHGFWSKRCGTCTLQLMKASHNRKKGHLSRCKRRVKRCIKQVAEIKQREGRLVIVEETDLTPCESQVMTPTSEPAATVGSVSYLSPAQGSTENFSKKPSVSEKSTGGADTKRCLYLKLSQLKNNGLEKMHRELKDGKFEAGDLSWEIPPKVRPKVKRLLTKYMTLRKQAGMMESQYIMKTVKSLMRLLGKKSLGSSRKLNDTGLLDEKRLKPEHPVGIEKETASALRTEGKLRNITKSCIGKKTDKTKDDSTIQIAQLNEILAKKRKAKGHKLHTKALQQHQQQATIKNLKGKKLGKAVRKRQSKLESRKSTNVEDAKTAEHRGKRKKREDKTVPRGNLNGKQAKQQKINRSKKKP